MRKHLSLSLLVIVITAFLLSVIGASSWLIIRWHNKAVTTNPETQPGIAVPAPDTSASFTSGKVYDGERFVISLTDIGRIVYGITEGTIEDYFDVQLYAYTLADDSGYDDPKTARDASLSSTEPAIYAGKHHYRIIEKATGQVVCDNHVVVIDKVEVSATAPAGGIILFAGKSYQTQLGITYPDGKRVEKNITITSRISDYGAPSTVNVSKQYYYTYTDNNYYINTDGEAGYSKANDNKIIIPYTLLGTTYATTTAGTKYYADISTALGAVTASGAKIVPMQSFTYGGKTYVSGTDFNHSITADSTVAAGVTLEIPTVDTTGTGYASYSNGKLVSTANGNARMTADTTKNTLHIGDGATLINNGTIIVSGVITGGGAQQMFNSVTSGIHAKISLATDAKLHNATDSSKIWCYGFIDEAASDNGSQIWLERGDFTSMFTMIEHRGGSTFLGMSGATGDKLSKYVGVGRETDPYIANVECFPFNRFFVQSATAKMRVESTAQLYGYVNLFADGVNNETTVDLLGKLNTSIIQLENNAVAEAKFNYNASNPLISRIDLDIKGDAKLNPLVISLKIEKDATITTAIIVVKLSTVEALFPLSYNWDVSFNKYENGNRATVDATGQGIKVLPGGRLTIGDNVIMNASSIAVYDYESTKIILDPEGTTNHEDYNLIVGTKYKPTAAQKDTPSKGKYTVVCNESDGYLGIAGELRVVNLGGAVTPISSSARLTVSGSNTVDSPELVGVESATMKITVLIVSKDVSYLAAVFSNDTTTISGVAVENAEALNAASLMQATGVIYDGITLAPFNTGTAYTAHKSGSTYYWRCAADNIRITYNSNGGTALSARDIGGIYSDGLVLDSSYLTAPTRQYYKFGGWYLDEELTKPAANARVFADTTLYAKWDVITYNITYTHNGYTPASDKMAGLPTSVTALDENVSLAIEALIDDYTFAGWYSGNSRIAKTTLSGSELLSYFSVPNQDNVTITIRGEWTKLRYYVVYTYPDGSTTEQIYAATQREEAPLPISVDAYDITKQLCYDHWLYNGAEVTTLADVIPADAEDGARFELTAGSSAKKVLNIVASNGLGIDLNITNIYVSQLQYATIMNEYVAQASASDLNTEISKYFLRFVDTENGNTEYDLTAGLRNEYFGDDGALTLTAEYADKYALNVLIDSGAAAIGTRVQVTVPTIYLHESQISMAISEYLNIPYLENAESYRAMAQAQDTNIATSRFFTGWNKDSISISDFVDKKLTVEATFGNKNVITVTGNSGAGVNPITLTGTIYIIESQIAEAFENYIKPYETQAKQYDLARDTNKYFSRWTDSSGDEIIVITSSMFTDGALTVTAVWENKYVLNISGNSGASTGAISFSKTEYATQSQIEAIITEYTKTAMDKDTDITVPRYFSHWEVGGVKVENGFVAPEMWQDNVLDISGVWADKYQLQVIADSGTDVIGTRINFTTNVFYLNPEQIKTAKTDFIDNPLPGADDSYFSMVTAQDDNTATNKYFGGWKLGTATIVTDDDLYALLASNASVAIEATWAIKTKLTFTSNNSNADTTKIVTTTQYYKPNTAGVVVTLPAIQGLDDVWSEQYYLISWKAINSSGTETLGITDTEYTLHEETEINIEWGVKTEVTVTVRNRDTITVTHKTASGTTATYSASGWAKPGDTVSATNTHNGDGDQSFTLNGNTYTPGTETTVGTSTLAFESSSSCIAAGTLITLADGSVKPVEELTMDDVLLVYDHESGRFVEAGIIFIEDDGWMEYSIINLKFSNGTLTRLIYEHALFDMTLGRYVYITESNCTDFIGHEFAMADGDGFTAVTLDEAYVTVEYTGCYSLVTVYHLNYLIDGMLSIPGGIDGIFNMFEYDSDLNYDAEQMKADIEKYGLYTYEDFAEYIPEEVYNMFQAQYFKIAVGKGHITFEQIIGYIEHYLVKHGYV